MLEPHTSFMASIPSLSGWLWSAPALELSPHPKTGRDMKGGRASVNYVWFLEKGKGAIETKQSVKGGICEFKFGYIGVTHKWAELGLINIILKMGGREGDKMVDSEVMKNVIAVTSGHYSKHGGEICGEKLKKRLIQLGKKYDSPFPENKELDKRLSEIIERPPKLGAQITDSMLAKWFEVPQDEFKLTHPDEVDPKVFFRHYYLEIIFKNWLKKWDYNVELGEELEDLEGLEFIAEQSPFVIKGCTARPKWREVLC